MCPSKEEYIRGVSYDCKTCFDQMERSQLNIYTQKQNMDANLLLARDICMESIERYVKMRLGVSVVINKQEKEEP